MPAFCLILACALWGLSFPILKVLFLEQGNRLPEASTTFLTAWIQLARFLFGAILMLPIVARLPRPATREIQQGCLLAFWGGLGMALQAWGLSLTAASTSAFLTQAYCVILPIVACVRSRRAPTRRIIGATLLVLAGGALLSGVTPSDLTPGPGETATLLAAIAFTFQILTLESPRFAENRGRPVTFIMCAVIAIIFLPVALITAPHPSAIIEAGASVATLSLTLVLALFCSVGAFLLMNSWQKRVSATEAGLIYTTEPVFAASYALFLPALLAQLTGAIYPNESLTPALLAGGGLILAANIWMQWKAKPHPPGLASVP